MDGLDRAAAKGKPVVLLKVGGTEAGKRAAFSHTGAIVGSARAYDAAFQQKGVLVARDIDELIDFSMALATTPPPRGNRVGIMTESGGGGVLLTERCAELGLEVGEIFGQTRDRLQKVVPALGSVRNPVDLTGQSLSNPALVKGAIEVMVDSEDFDMVVPLLLMSEATAERKVQDFLDILQAREKDGRTVLVCWPEGPKPWIQYLVQKGVHVSVTPSRCARTLKALSTFAEFQRQYKGAAVLDAAAIPDLPGDRVERAMGVIRSATRDGEIRLTEHQARLVLNAYGIPMPKGELAGSLKEALRIAKGMGYPVAAKLVSPDIPHKTEAGVVGLGIPSESRLRRVYSEILQRGKAHSPEARIHGILIQEMIRDQGIETIVGVSHEPPFGPTLLFGLGGILVEVMADVAIRVLPVTKKDLEGMVSQIRGYPILQGVRGRRPSDMESLLSVLMKVACLAGELAGVVAEVDINPLFVLEEGKGVKALDALISLHREKAV
jgi:acyl-CoA synthetase (NDP forming)